MTLKLNNFVIASLALAKLQFITYIFYITITFIHINDIFTSFISYLRKLNNMTLKQKSKPTNNTASFGTILNNMTLKLFSSDNNSCGCFGTILNNMTLKRARRRKKRKASFGTILNNMTLKPRRIIFSPKFRTRITYP